MSPPSFLRLQTSSSRRCSRCGRLLRRASSPAGRAWAWPRILLIGFWNRPRLRGGAKGVRHEPCRRHGCDHHDGDSCLLPVGVLLGFPPAQARSRRPPPRSSVLPARGCGKSAQFLCRPGWATPWPDPRLTRSSTRPRGHRRRLPDRPLRRDVDRRPRRRYRRRHHPARSRSLFGAIVGCAKDDMKKVSPASAGQIGYMMAQAWSPSAGHSRPSLHPASSGVSVPVPSCGGGRRRSTCVASRCLRGAMEVTG